jgi:hypothetical protein
VQPAFPDGQRALADIVPGLPAQHREVLGPADVHEPYVDQQGRIKIAA